MQKYKILNLLSWIGLFCSIITPSFAQDTLKSDPPLPCPEVSTLHTTASNIFSLMPYAYDRQTGKMQYSAVLSYSYRKTDFSANALFLIYPISNVGNESSLDSTLRLINQLQPVTKFAEPQSVIIKKRLPVSVCAYSSSEDSQINALLYLDHGNTEFGPLSHVQNQLTILLHQMEPSLD